MMRRKKHTNSCLLNLLALVAGSGFILLCIAFGLYFLTEKPSVYEKDNIAMSTPISLGTRDEIKINQEAKVSSEIEERDESVESAIILPEEEIEENPLKESAEGVKEERPVLNAPIDTSSEAAVKPTTEAKEEELEFEEVTVYDSYVLQLDENILGQIGDTLKDGQIDYGAVVSQMFSSLSFSEQVKLLNMILSKVQNVNINEIWNMISDGISKEDSIKLQELVQEHFTLEELDKLYGYYASMDIAGSEE